MPPERRIALAFRPDPPDHRLRGLLAGIRRFAEARPTWQFVLDPDARYHLPGGYDGVIGPTGKQLALACREARVPFVGVGGNNVMVRVPRVRELTSTAGCLAARHLQDQGYQRFAALGQERNSAAGRLVRSFRDTIRRMGHSIHLLTVVWRARRSPSSWRVLRAHLDDWISRWEPPIGVLVYSDFMARIVAEHCLARGLRIPADVGLVAAGNDPALCDFPAPALTAVDFHFEDVGLAAAGLLDHILYGSARVPHDLRVNPTLIPRASTDTRFRQDPLVTRALDYIERYCLQPTLRVADVARALGVSRRLLDLRFRQVFRPSVATELRQARLRRALRLLGTTDLSVADVAREAGFPSRPALTAALRAAHGITPRTYRLRAARKGKMETRMGTDEEGRGNHR